MTDDERIIDLFNSRDESAIAELAAKYGDICAKVARNILRNAPDAEECVSDTYLATWNAIPPAEPNPLKAFVLRILRNIATAKYHKNTAQRRNSHYDAALDELEDCLADVFTVERELESAELSRCIDKFLDTLDHDSRLMFMCRYWRSDGLDDIAAKFGTSSHNVASRLFRIRGRLKKFLKKEGYEV